MTEWWIDIQNVKIENVLSLFTRCGLADASTEEVASCPCLAHPLGTTLSALGLSLQYSGVTSTSSGLQFFRFQNHIDKMLTPILKRQVLQCSKYGRYFSSSPIVAANEVKRLGVIGAGQMVFLAHVTSGLDIFADQTSGFRNSLGGRNESRSVSSFSGFKSSFN
jgi:hypothetical protein